MRKINGKLFLFLLLGGAAAAVTAVAVHYFQYGRIANALLWQARQASEQGQPRRSAEYLQRYLEFSPRDLAEKARLARLWAGDAYPAGSRVRHHAVALLDDVLTYQDDPELRRLLVKTALEVNDFRRAREHLAILLPWNRVEEEIKKEGEARARLPLERSAAVNPPQGELEAYWGKVQEFDRKPTEAIGCYRVAMLHAPKIPESYIGLAYLLRRHPSGDATRRKQDFADADQAIDHLVSRNAENCDAYLARWRYRREFELMAIREAFRPGDSELPLERAAQDVVEAEKRRPDSVDVVLALADLERLRGRAAAEAFDRPVDDRRKEMNQHRRKALEHLRRGLQMVSTKKSGASEAAAFPLLWHTGNLLLDDLDLLRLHPDTVPDRPDGTLRDEIAQVIDEVRKTHMPAAADYMKGRLEINNGHWAQAVQLLERARLQMATQRDLACQANLYLGQCYERLEEHAQMFNAFKRVTDEDPTAVSAILGKAAARWAQGLLGEAREEYLLAVRQKAVPPRAWIDLARLEIQRQGAAPEPDWTLADQALTNGAKSLKEDHVELVLLRAEVALRKKKPGTARQILEAARKAKPGEAEFHTALIDLSLRDRNPARARELLEEAKSSLADSVALRLARARVLAAVDGKKAAGAITALGENPGAFSEADQGRLLAGLADTLFRAEATREARAMWQRLPALPRFKVDLRLHMLLFDLAMKEDDQAGMEQTLKDVKKIEQNGGTFQRYGEALFLIWQAKQDAKGRGERLERAREHLDAVLAQRPSWAPLYLARAEIAELNGAPDQAIKDLEEARKAGEDSPTVIRRLATLLTQTGRHAEAGDRLAQLNQSLLADSDLGRLFVTVALRRGETNQALDLMRRAVREDTQDPKKLLWMALVQATARRPAEAEKLFKAAVRRSESGPDAWVALVQFLAAQQRKADALAVVEEMKKKVPAAKLPRALGPCYDALGMSREAEASFKQALAECQDDPEVMKGVAVGHLAANRPGLAEPILRRLAGSEVPGTVPADLDWARRNLALLLAAGTSHKRFSEALELVGLSLDANGRLPRELPVAESTELRRTQARVLASQNQKHFRDHAVRLLEGLSVAKALNPDDEFVLAMLYEADQETRKSQDRLRALSQAKTRTPRYLAQYVTSLLSHQPGAEALAEAERLIVQIEGIEKEFGREANGFASVDLRARLLEARGKADGAIALLSAHVNREKARPEEKLLLLAALSRQRRYADAFALCEKAWQDGKIPPEVMGAVSVGLLGVMAGSDAQVAALEKHMVAAQEKNPEKTVLRLHLATLYDQRAKYARAAEQYREVLRREPNNVVALNNLAWLMGHPDRESRDQDNRDALDYINKAITGMGRRPDLLDTRGMVHLAARNTDKALEDLREASAESPTPVRLYHLARALDRDGNRSRAGEVLREAKLKGLEEAKLHPVEQQACRSLLEKYSLR